MNKSGNHFSALGKRKTSVAKVFLKSGEGVIKINEKPFENFFSNIKSEQDKIKNGILLAKLNGLLDLTVFVKGGGISSQLEAITLAISKALCLQNDGYRSKFNKRFFLRSDSRIKERRKYGLKKARKASQYSKR
eukprot:GDKK01057373.1.p5 GENE.GDKK01057373.1~~GDKK01057373.1.p5  ORF type:complete len:134 (+),score=13.76 GDKK01057373.1:1701-2102(+)